MSLLDHRGVLRKVPPLVVPADIRVAPPYGLSDCDAPVM